MEKEPRRPRNSKDKKWKCPLCPKVYHDGRSLSRHVRGKHGEQRNLPSVLSAIRCVADRRETCPYCAATFVALRKHIKICPERVPQDGSKEIPQNESLVQMSNEHFVKFYKAKLQKDDLSPSTVSAYVSALKVPIHA